jgi:hypothetical protein
MINGGAYLVIGVIIESASKVNTNNHGDERKVCDDRRENIVRCLR